MLLAERLEQQTAAMEAVLARAAAAEQAAQEASARVSEVCVTVCHAVLSWCPALYASANAAVTEVLSSLGGSRLTCSEHAGTDSLGSRACIGASSCRQQHS